MTKDIELEMKPYIGTKMIKAMPMDRAEYNLYRGWKLPENENGEDKGMLVEYLDGGESNHYRHEGYISWSPIDVFEKAYQNTESGMTFGHAVELMKAGFKVARKGWNGNGMFAVLSPGSKQLPAGSFFNKDLASHADDMGGFMDVRPAFMLKTAQNDVAYWAPSGSDCLAEDWVIVE